MKVKDLILKLQKLHPERHVAIANKERDYFTFNFDVQSDLFSNEGECIQKDDVKMHVDDDENKYDSVDVTENVVFWS